MEYEGKLGTKGPPAEFQTAMAATKFGLSNVVLLLVSVPAAWTVQVESTLSSYIAPAAACDLDMDPAQKGLLSSSPFFGMVIFTLIWGFLLDMVGRRPILVYCFALHTLVVLLKSGSQNFPMLFVLNFFGGALTGGIYTAVTTYILEFYSTEYRSRIQMAFGVMYSSASIMIPLMSSVILPLNVQLKSGSVELHGWNVLILASSVYPAMCVAAFYFLPETPKYLMSIGENEKALDIFRTMYKWNTGRPKESYPVKVLIEEANPKPKSEDGKSWNEHLKNGWEQMSPLFHKQYMGKLMLVCIVQGIFLMAMNAIRLYMPLIFQATHEYEISHNGTSTTLCNLLTLLRTQAPGEKQNGCTVNLEDSFQVYVNSAIIASVNMVAYIFSSFIIRLLGKKLIVILGAIASISISCLYFSPDTITTLSLSSICLTTLVISSDILIPVIVVMFPTTLRAMAMSVCALGGRLLSVVGTNLMPLLVDAGCAPPFFALGAVVMAAVLLSCLIPNTDKDDMK